MAKKRLPRRNFNKLDLAYAAGFFDGEGSVLIDRGKQTKNPYCGFRLEVKISSTSEEIIKCFKETFGAGTIEVRKKYTSGGKDYWSWIVAGNRAAEFLELIYPYLKVKSEDAEIGILFQDSVDRYSSSNQIPAPEIEYRKKLIWKLRNLPHRRKAKQYKYLWLGSISTKK